MSRERAKGTAAERAVADDIVTRLREYEAITDNAYVINALVAAADEIERLRTELNLARRAYDMEIFGESDIDENGVWRDE